VFRPVDAKRPSLRDV